jgi:SAM-dependent methyltransferase
LDETPGAVLLGNRQTYQEGAMRPSIKEFVSIAAATLPIGEPIYEFGSLQVPGQEGFADLRPLFPGKQYVGVDMRPGPGVDKVLDLHDIDLPAQSVGTVLSLDTLEHVEHPHRAMEQIHRLLKPDGLAIISSVMDFPIHDYPYDYWRFTPEAFRAICKPFTEVFVGSAGRADFPHTVVGVAFKSKAPDTAEFRRRYEAWRRRKSLKDIVRSITPPVLLPLLLTAYRAGRDATRSGPGTPNRSFRSAR